LEFSETNDSHQPKDVRIAPTGNAHVLIKSSGVSEKLELTTGHTISPTTSKIMLITSKAMKTNVFLPNDPSFVVCMSEHNLNIAGINVTALE
jgi:hypothetical protein